MRMSKNRLLRDAMPVLEFRTLSNKILASMVAQAMYVVIRQGKYPAEFRLEATAEFREFQEIHAAQPGYQGTTVAHLGQGRYVTVTAWETEDDMHAARKALQSTADRLLNAHMLEPSNLIGTGPVVYCD